MILLPPICIINALLIEYAASPPDVTKRALLKLDILNAAHRLIDLRSPPSNRLEAVKGDLAGFYSIRVNQQWRIIFRWVDNGVVDVALVDYH
ncbi:MAG: type II toxin-antitoxin system RelE/ParE family toxin [Anaerolineae bacterium]|nr:type II toxin-antitoxin system RelE/ParE family toxin [Anaerolineae bacterium]